MYYHLKGEDMNFSVEISGTFLCKNDNYYLDYKVNDDTFRIIIQLL